MHVSNSQETWRHFVNFCQISEKNRLIKNDIRIVVTSQFSGITIVFTHSNFLCSWLISLALFTAFHSFRSFCTLHSYWNYVAFCYMSLNGRPRSRRPDFCVLLSVLIAFQASEKNF